MGGGGVGVWVGPLPGGGVGVGVGVGPGGFVGVGVVGGKVGGIGVGVGEINFRVPIWRFFLGPIIPESTGIPAGSVELGVIFRV